MLYLYDPKTNISVETSYAYLVELTGKTYDNLASYKSRKRKIQNIDCYLIDDKTTIQERKAFYCKETYPDEVWRPIHGSDQKYRISSYGRVQRILKNGDTPFILPYLKKRTGYLEIKVPYNGVYKNYKVSNLVALHFIGKPKKGEVLHHKNGIKTDSAVSNLAYQDQSKVSRKTGPLAKSKPVVQLDKDTLDVIGEYRSAREAGRMTYLSYQAVLDNCNHKTKSSGGYLFMFASEYEQLYQEEA